MRKIILSGLILASILNGSEVKDTDKFVTMFVDGMAKELPKRFNKHTTLGAIAKLDKLILFSFVTSAKTNQKQLNNNKVIFDNEWCNEKFLVDNMLKKGYSFASMLYDKNNKKLGEITTTYNNCVENNIKGKYREYLYKLTDEESEYFYQNFNSFKQDADYRRYDEEYKE